MYNVVLFLHLWDVMPCPERNVARGTSGLAPEKEVVGGV